LNPKAASCLLPVLHVAKFSRTSLSVEVERTLRLGVYDRAIAEYSKAIAMNKNDADSLYGRGVAKQKKAATPTAATPI